MPWSIDDHRKELAQALCAARRDIENYSARPKRTYPPRYATFIWFMIRKEPVPAEISINMKNSEGHAVRQIHDFYGWKAKGTTKERGLCSGSLYRTAGYMAHPPDVRAGQKGHNRTVHIEHSVPVSVLLKLLKFHANDFETPADLHNFLILHSVATAFSAEEEGHMKGVVVSSRNLAFQNTGERTGDHPFLRYKPLLGKEINFRLYNIVTGEEINLDTFTFEDHKNTLTAASELCGMQSGLGVYDLHAFRTLA